MQYEKMYDVAKEQGKTAPILPTFIKFENVGDKVIGKYLSRSITGETEKKKGYYQYIFETDLGPVKFHLGSVMDNEVGSQFTEGEIYYICFEGKRDIPGGKRVNQFTVEKVDITNIEIPKEEVPF